jgi:hypothetical protein
MNAMLAHGVALDLRAQQAEREAERLSSRW